MDDPGRRPLVLVQCGWPRDRELLGELLGALGAEMRPVGEPGGLRTLLDDDRVDLVLADSAAGLGDLGDLLHALDGRAETTDLPLVLLADPEELTSLADLTARRFNAVLLTKPLGREQLSAAVESGLRYRDRQRQVRHLLRQLEASNAELEDRRAEATEEARRKTRFLAAISHDIRTPVNALVLTCQLLQLAGEGGDGRREVLELTGSLRVNAASLVELVNDLLDIALFDQGKLEFKDSDFPLGGFVAAAIDGVRPLAEQKSLTLLAEVANPSAVLRADRVKLGRVVQNLVSNAIKFTDAGGVCVGVRAGTADGLVLTVRDTGVGIPESMWESIFDEFAQLRNPERDRTKGTGLGLAICRRLVTAMGGEIRVASAPGQPGSTFLVTLPPGRVVADDGGGETRPGANPVGPVARFEGRVLVVDDHDPSRTILARVLRRFGLGVEVAANGREALAQLDRVRPDLVLLDLMMPEMGGLDALRVIRGRPDLDGLPVVILTGDVSEKGDADLTEAGASACLSKPVDLPKLIAVLAELLPAGGTDRGGKP